MSILKNTTSALDLGYTIKRLSTLPVGSVQTQIVQYLHLVKAVFKPSFALSATDAILIRAIIPTDISVSEGAYAYIFGRKYASGEASNNMWIAVKNISGVKKMVWGVGSQEVVGPTIDGLSHDYGFVGGYAVMDNKKVDNSHSPVSATTLVRPYIGGLNNNGATLYCPDMYLLRADYSIYASSDPEVFETPYLCRYYPVETNDIRNAMRVFDEYLNPDLGSGGSSTVGPALEKPYGIQLDDLKYLTGSGYKDLMAIVCCDGGEDSRIHPQNTEGAYTGITGHYFAFDLSGTKIPGGRTPDPALPYQRGKLSAGRRPLGWDVWNDCIDRGFYVRNDNGTYMLEFNIFKKTNGDTDNEIHLDMFEGYNTDLSCVHPPLMTINNPNADVQFHNGQNYRTRLESVCVPIKDGSLYLDDKCIFYVENVADMDYNVKLGNTIPWNTLQANLGQEYGIVGGGVTIKIGGNVYASTASRETSVMCADSPASASARDALKTKYRTTGVGGALLLNYLTPTLRNILLSATGNTVAGTAEISLVNNLNHKILMPDFSGAQAIQLTGEFNTTVDGEDTSSEVTTRRNFLAEYMTASSTTKYLTYMESHEIRNLTCGGYGPYELRNMLQTGQNSDLLILMAKPCDANGAFLEQNPSYYAMVTLDRASMTNHNKLTARYACMVAGTNYQMKFYDATTDFEPSERVSTNKEFVVKSLLSWEAGRDYIDYFNNGHYTGSISMNTTMFTNYNVQFAAIPCDFGIASDYFGSSYPTASYASYSQFPATGEKDKIYIDSSTSSKYFWSEDEEDYIPVTRPYSLDDSNIRFDVFRSDIIRTLAIYDGAFMSNPETTAWVHGTLARNTTPVFVHRLPDELIVPSNGPIINTYMRKFKNTNSSPDITDTSGWQAFNEGPDTQLAPSFVGTIKLYKKGLTDSAFTLVATFAYTSSDSFGSATSVFPRQYTEITKTQNNYTCKVNFSEQPAPFNSPNGGAETLENTGYLWYYSCVITTTNTVSAGDTYKVTFE